MGDVDKVRHSEKKGEKVRHRLIFIFSPGEGANLGEILIEGKL